MFIIDSSTSQHIVCDPRLFTPYQTEPSSEDKILLLANRKLMDTVVHGRGSASFKMKDSDGMCRTIKLENVLFIPAFQHNLFSVTAATRKGAVFKFGKEAQFSTPNGVKFCINRSVKLYHIDIQAVHQEYHKNKATTAYSCVVGSDTEATSPARLINIIIFMY